MLLRLLEEQRQLIDRTKKSNPHTITNSAFFSLRTESRPPLRPTTTVPPSRTVPNHPIVQPLPSSSKPQLSTQQQQLQVNVSKPPATTLQVEPQQPRTARSNQQQQQPPHPAPLPDVNAVPLRPPEEVEARGPPAAPVELGPEILEVKTTPCPMCERPFATERLDAHMKICKSVKKDRGVYDSTAKRKEGISDSAGPVDTASYGTSGNHHHQSSGGTSGATTAKNNWRQKHQMLQHTLNRSRKGSDGADALPEPEMIDDRVQCPHCMRKFNEDVAKKHVDKCMYAKTNMNNNRKK
eukprot:PhF_6_TR12230/c0_g1_i2/m.19365